MEERYRRAATMIAVRTDRSAELARSRALATTKQPLPGEGERGESLLVKLQRPVPEARRPKVAADLCFGCVDWYMYPRRQPDAPTNNDTG
jgi:hypothetical protein